MRACDARPTNRRAVELGPQQSAPGVALTTRELAPATEERVHAKRIPRVNPRGNSGRCAMTISKRLRFEILRRDGHKCQYCGEEAPKVKLTVDHVLAVSLGGTDEASNLVTACAECNAGKSSATVDASFVEQVARDAAAWDQAKAAVKEGRAAGASMFRGFEDELDSFLLEWRCYRQGHGCSYELPDDWRRSVRVWLLRDLTIDTLKELMHVAMNADIPQADVWRYLCGCAWRSIAQMEQAVADEYARLQAQAAEDRRLANKVQIDGILADALKRVDE